LAFVAGAIVAALPDDHEGPVGDGTLMSSIEPSTMPRDGSQAASAGCL
jgi:hypothetical protein